jgi:hypothetical protein
MSKPDRTRIKSDDHWDGGCSTRFRVKVLALLADLYGQRDLSGKKIIKDGTPLGNDVAFLHVLNGPLGSVEHEYRRLALAPIETMPTRVAGAFDRGPVHNQ